MRTLLIGSLLFLLCACSQEQSNFEHGIENQILHIANADEPRELDPQLSTGSPESNIHRALSEGLITREAKTLAIQPGVAERWELDAEKRRYTFYLRKDARWSNGDPLTAHDFVWSWQRSLMPKLSSEWAYMKYYIKNAQPFNEGKLDDFTQVGIKALDDYVFEVELNEPTGFFLKLLSHPSYAPVHKDTVLAHADIDQPVSNWTRPENWVGNGPFKLTSWEINRAITVEKNSLYWDAANVKLNGIHFYPITDQQAEVRAFRAGQVHLTYSPQMAIEKVQHYKENEPESLRITPTYSSYYYELNVNRPPLDDKRVRRALALAIDRKTLVERVTKAGERPAYSLVPNDPAGYSPKQLFEFDRKKAQALLAEAGYPGGENFPEIDLLYNTLDNHRKVALAIQQMLNENLGIRVRLTNQEWKVYLNTRRDKQYDIARAGWIADYLDPSNFFELLLSYSGNNRTGWANQEYDDIIEQLKSTSADDARNNLFARADAILVEEMPIIPLYLYSDVNLVAPEVKGWYDNVRHYHPYNRVYLEAR